MTIDEFKKIELVAGKVLEASRVENSDKLLKITVDLGEGKRQILAGIGKNYSPEALLGKTIIIVANLEPRILMGLESQGMLLAAAAVSGPVILTTESDVPAGALIK